MFGSVGSWKQSTGTLVLSVAQNKLIQKGKMFQFSIVSLGQPIRSQAAPDLQISLDGGVNFVDMEVKGVFQSSVPPKIVVVSPAAGAVGIASGDTFVIQFDKSLEMTGSGTVQFWDRAGVAVGAEIACDPSSSVVSITGGQQEMLQVKVPGTAVATAGAFYYMTMSSGKCFRQPVLSKISCSECYYRLHFIDSRLWLGLVLGFHEQEDSELLRQGWFWTRNFVFLAD